MLRILRHHELNYIVNICYENCFLADAQATFNFAVFSLRVQPFSNLYARIALALTDTDIYIKTQFGNGVRIYRGTAVMRKISELLAQYPSI